MPQIDSGKAVAAVLKAEGVSHVFSLPGGEILPIYDALVAEGIEIITTRHEQAAGNAADGWARITRTPGVCMVSAFAINSMPGTINPPRCLPSAAMASMVIAVPQSITAAGPL